MRVVLSKRPKLVCRTSERSRPFVSSFSVQSLDRVIGGDFSLQTFAVTEMMLVCGEMASNVVIHSPCSKFAKFNWDLVKHQTGETRNDRCHFQIAYLHCEDAAAKAKMREQLIWMHR